MNLFIATISPRLDFNRNQGFVGHFRDGVTRFFMVVLMLLLCSVSINAQKLYSISSTNVARSYELSTGAVTVLPNMSPGAGGSKPNFGSTPGKIYGSIANGVTLQFFNGTAWSTLGTSSNVTAKPFLKYFTDGTNLYYMDDQSSSTQIFRYDATAATWSNPAVLSAKYTGCSGKGVIYFTSVGSSGNIQKYDPSTGTVSTVAPIPSGVTIVLFWANSTDIFMTNSSGSIFKVNIATGTSTNLGIPSPTMGFYFATDTELYGRNGTTVYKRAISSGTWAAASFTLPTGSNEWALDGAFFSAAPACAAPVVTATATSPTCTGTTPNSNGTLTLTAFNTNAMKVGYSLGSTYTGPAFASATTITGTAPFTVVNTLANPAFNQPYTIRIFCDATTFVDKTVILAPKQCSTADLSISISPATQTGNVGETLTYTVTLANAGPNPATNVVVSVPIPIPTATLLSAVGASGSYDSVTKRWTVPNLPVGSTTLTFSLQVN